jgi:chemotaxis-related protein WspD
MDQPNQPVMEQCWSRIGVWGKADCPRLAEHIHCRNCPVYKEQGRRLLDRAAPEGYLREWTRLLAESKTQGAAGDLSVMVFRVLEELLAVQSAWLGAVDRIRRIHGVPGRSNRVFLGLVNIQGELLLAASLAGLLGLEAGGAGERASRGEAAALPRLLVLEINGQRWAAPVDEVFGLARLNHGDLEAAPVTLTKSAANYTRGLFEYQGRKAALLDEELLINGLNRSL